MDHAQGCTSNPWPIKLKRSKLTNLSTMPGQSDRGLAETQDYWLHCGLASLHSQTDGPRI